MSQSKVEKMRLKMEEQSGELAHWASTASLGTRAETSRLANGEILLATRDSLGSLWWSKRSHRSRKGTGQDQMVRVNSSSRSWSRFKEPFVTSTSQARKLWLRLSIRNRGWFKGEIRSWIQGATKMANPRIFATVWSKMKICRRWTSSKTQSCLRRSKVALIEWRT